MMNDIRITKIFGPPGTGKTTWILNKIEELLEKGVRPNKISFVSFTNKAVDELIDRALKKFNRYEKDDFPWFRTIHSLCNKVRKDNLRILSQNELLKFAKEYGLDCSNFYSLEDGCGAKTGDKILQIENLARLRQVSLEEQFEDSKITEFSFFSVKTWREKYEEFKKIKKYIDFTDLLENFDFVLDVDYFFIDEAQDLSTLQWKVVEKVSKKALKIYIAGDDDQSIYKWAGADTKYFLNIYDKNDIILTQSYRLSPRIFKSAKKILDRINFRKEKIFYPIENYEGQVEKIVSLREINFESKTKYLILFRNKWQSKEVEEELKNRGLFFFKYGEKSIDEKIIRIIELWKSNECNFSQEIFSLFNKYTDKKINSGNIDCFKKIEWFKVFNLISLSEKEYILELLKNKVDLFKEPNISVSTIHQAKGGEADNVILFTDVSYSTWKDINTDDEHRVWYVAVTRAKKKLFIVVPKKNQFYQLNGV